MYAIVETGGKQYRVKPGDTIAVERVAGEPGEVLDLGRVLLVAGDGDTARVGSPGVAGAVVRAEVVEHARGEKIVVFRYKSKVRYRRKTGHRQALTRLRITDIVLDGHSTSAAPAQEAPVAEPRAIDRSEVPTEPVLEETAPTTEGRAGRAVAATAAAETATAEAESDLPASAGEAGPPPEEDEPERTGV
jgi:large subunit ribosomal protein L21